MMFQSLWHTCKNASWQLWCLHVERPSRFKTIIFVNINMVSKVTSDVDSSSSIPQFGSKASAGRDNCLWLNVFDRTPPGWRNWDKDSKNRLKCRWLNKCCLQRVLKVLLAIYRKWPWKGYHLPQDNDRLTYCLRAKHKEVVTYCATEISGDGNCPTWWRPQVRRNLDIGQFTCRSQNNKRNQTNGELRRLYDSMPGLVVKE